ncbi:hypothetical protein SB767_32605, partial [Bacillus sp. SIMBA_069]
MQTYDRCAGLRPPAVGPVASLRLILGAFGQLRLESVTRTARYPAHRWHKAQMRQTVGWNIWL